MGPCTSKYFFRIWRSCCSACCSLESTVGLDLTTRYEKAKFQEWNHISGRRRRCSVGHKTCSSWFTCLLPWHRRRTSSNWFCCSYFGPYSPPQSQWTHRPCRSPWTSKCCGTLYWPLDWDQMETFPWGSYFTFGSRVRMCSSYHPLSYPDPGG